MNEQNRSGVKAGPERNPLYLKIGKRIRQARLMAHETNSRDLSLRLGWSAGRIHNYESGISTPGVDETLQLCAALGIDPGWLTYGIGAPQAPSVQANRYRRFMQSLDAAEAQGRLAEMQQALRLPDERLRKFRKNPHARIPDLMARRCEKYLGRQRGWIDRPSETPSAAPELAQDARDLLDLYARLSTRDRERLYAIGQLLLD